jgi:UDP-2-acetamido-2-deoxy-ribo-hexuluronate aminotransferase
MQPIKFVDLHGQYIQRKAEIDQAIQNVLSNTDFIQGAQVKRFEGALSKYLGGDTQVISCGNGTDALQIAMMALDLKPGDEVILPVHTYVATAEVIALLKLVPVFADVVPGCYTLDVSAIERLITKKTAAIVPVHLYGQCAEMQPIFDIAEKHGLVVIEDAAQSLGADYKFLNGASKKSGTLGKIGTTSFFPSKNLGAYGDGGAIFTQESKLADRLRAIANHGQRRKYFHDFVGVNSRLDTIQAAILDVKLKYLDEYSEKRSQVATYYDRHLNNPLIRTPQRAAYSSHVFHQYTITVSDERRDELRSCLEAREIPTMIYYPVPLHLQVAYRKEGFGEGSFPVAESLSKSVLSLPIHTEMQEEQLSYICDCINGFL